ncbi:MAG: heavy-metal-associated domain-containing protein [Elsteraceae bacterium]
MELMVKGMTCGGCVKAVTRALQAQDKAAVVNVDLPSGKVTIEGAISKDQAEAAIRDAGFTLAA